MEPTVIEMQDLGDGLLAYAWTDESGAYWIDYIDTDSADEGLTIPAAE